MAGESVRIGGSGAEETAPIGLNVFPVKSVIKLKHSIKCASIFLYSCVFRSQISRRTQLPSIPFEKSSRALLEERVSYRIHVGHTDTHTHTPPFTSVLCVCLPTPVSTLSSRNSLSERRKQANRSACLQNTTFPPRSEC